MKKLLLTLSLFIGLLISNDISAQIRIDSAVTIKGYTYDTITVRLSVSSQHIKITNGGFNQYCNVNLLTFYGISKSKITDLGFCDN